VLTHERAKVCLSAEPERARLNFPRRLTLRISKGTPAVSCIISLEETFTAPSPMLHSKDGHVAHVLGACASGGFEPGRGRCHLKYQLDRFGAKLVPGQCSPTIHSMPHGHEGPQFRRGWFSLMLAKSIG
jgi:hypothetical protein